MFTAWFAQKVWRLPCFVFSWPCLSNVAHMLRHVAHMQVCSHLLESCLLCKAAHTPVGESPPTCFLCARCACACVRRLAPPHGLLSAACAACMYAPNCRVGPRLPATIQPCGCCPTCKSLLAVTVVSHQHPMGRCFEETERLWAVHQRSRRTRQVTSGLAGHRKKGPQDSTVQKSQSPTHSLFLPSCCCCCGPISLLLPPPSEAAAGASEPAAAPAVSAAMAACLRSARISSPSFITSMKRRARNSPMSASLGNSSNGRPEMYLHSQSRHMTEHGIAVRRCAHVCSTGKLTAVRDCALIDQHALLTRGRGELGGWWTATGTETNSNCDCPPDMSPAYPAQPTPVDGCLEVCVRVVHVLHRKRQPWQLDGWVTQQEAAQVVRRLGAIQLQLGLRTAGEAQFVRRRGRRRRV